MTPNRYRRFNFIITKQIFSYTPEEDQLILDTEIQWVRENFFPNWDKSGKWAIEAYHHHPGFGGSCVRKLKKIFIHNHLLDRRDGKLRRPTLLRLTIIHEVAHAVLPKHCNHGRRWIAIMDDCVKRADQLNMRKLGNILSLECERYLCRNAGRIYAEAVYARIRELAQKRPNLTFEKIIQYLDYMAGVATVAGNTVLDKKFKLCRKVYEVEKRKISKSKRYFFINKQLVA